MLYRFEAFCCVVAVFAVACGERNEDCTQLDVSYLVKTCQIHIIFELRTHSSNCTEAYAMGKKCFDGVFEDCYHEETEQNLKYKERELVRFGDEDTYCVYGGLRTIKPVIDNVDPEKCEEVVTTEMIEKIENPFYNEFHRNVSSLKLCKLYKDTRDLQNNLLSMCMTSLVDENFEDPAVSSEFIPYCPNIKSQLDAERQSILEGNNHHATSADVMIPVIVICCLLGAVIIVGVCWMARNERKKKKTEANTQQKVVTDADPMNGKHEAIPLATVVTNENEGISSA